MSTPEQPRPGGDTVELAIPADVAYISILRHMAASLSARCNLTIDDIEDLQLAVDEACSLLLPHAVPGSKLDAQFRLTAGSLTVQTSVHTSDDAQPDRTGFAWTVLGALASTIDVAQPGHRLTITVTKIREAADR